MRFVAGRGAVVEKQAGALMQMAGVFLAEMQLAVRALAQKHRVKASGKRVHDGQGDARWERRCTTDKHRRARATACTAGKEMHDGRGVARRTSTAAPGEPLAHRTAGRGTLLLFGWCA